MRRQRRGRTKWDESDFEFQTEDWSAPKVKEYASFKGRVVTVPPRRKRFGKERMPIEVCLHDRPFHVACPTCEYEAPRLAPLQMEGA